MTYDEAVKTRPWERMTLTEYLECWRSVPADLVERIHHLNWNRKIRIPHILVDVKAFAVTWHDATPEMRRRMREEIENA